MVYGILNIMIEKQALINLYQNDKKSVSTIAKIWGCSEGKINYWLKKFSIQKRSISDAVYIQNNPQGDPFNVQKPKVNEEWFLYGLGLGLYWGEGNKRNKNTVRLGNTDPHLLLTFLKFLTYFYKVDVKRLRFSLQIFTDIDPNIAKDYWVKNLSIPVNQFQKIVISKSVNKKGTYNKKSQYGVLTINFSNIKLRDTIVGAIDKLRTGPD